jgi:hypothetical protein
MVIGSSADVRGFAASIIVLVNGSSAVAACEHRQRIINMPGNRYFINSSRYISFTLYYHLYAPKVFTTAAALGMY